MRSSCTTRTDTISPSPSARDSWTSPPNRVSIVTDMAIPADKIDEAKAEEAHQRALARLEEKLSDEEVASVNASLVRSLAQLHVKRRHRAGG